MIVFLIRVSLHTHRFTHCKQMPSTKTYKDVIMAASTSTKAWQGWCTPCNVWQLEYTLSRDSCGGYFCRQCGSMVDEHTLQKR